MSDDKNEEPTDKKIEDARDKGQIAVSRDLAKLATLVVVAYMAFGTEPLWRQAINSLFALSFSRIGKPFSEAVDTVTTSAGLLLLLVFCICFVVCILVAVAANWGQFGVLVSFESLTPNIDKLNPVNGAKQLFSKKKLVELLNTLFKVAMIGYIVYILVRNQLPTIITLAGGTPEDIVHAFNIVLKNIFNVIVVLCFLLGALDLIIQKHFHKKQLMMDMEEIKREHKESEGDPMVKGQRKQLAHQWANEAPASRTEEANAVVVNPTHFAVAMFYDPAQNMVPVVLAKGKDETAAAMIARARQFGIPVIRHVWLARTLYATAKADEVIPKSSYESVALVYAVIQELIAQNDIGREVELESHGLPPQSAQP
ncbi:MAG: type III secretion system export apparatus subunit SctU [Janthinobacterium lividum]